MCIICEASEESPWLDRGKKAQMCLLLFNIYHRTNCISLVSNIQIYLSGFENFLSRHRGLSSIKHSISLIKYPFTTFKKIMNDILHTLNNQLDTGCSFFLLAYLLIINKGIVELLNYRNVHPCV